MYVCLYIHVCCHKTSLRNCFNIICADACWMHYTFSITVSHWYQLEAKLGVQMSTEYSTTFTLIRSLISWVVWPIRLCAGETNGRFIYSSSVPTIPTFTQMHNNTRLRSLHFGSMLLDIPHWPYSFPMLAFGILEEDINLGIFPLLPQLWSYINPYKILFSP